MPACSNFIDPRKRCPNTATWKRFYPGREPDYVCDYHMRAWFIVADTCGFVINFERLPEHAEHP